MKICSLLSFKMESVKQKSILFLMTRKKTFFYLKWSTRRGLFVWVLTTQRRTNMYLSLSLFVCVCVCVCVWVWVSVRECAWVFASVLECVYVCQWHYYVWLFVLKGCRDWWCRFQWVKFLKVFFAKASICKYYFIF